MAEFFTAGEDLAANFVQRIMTGLDARGRPGRKGGAGGFNGGVDLRCVSLGVFTDDIGQVRRVDVGAIVSTGYPLAVDVVIETL
ncbi:hypothetical protein D3C84_1171880 [compost metagenome]